MLYAVVYFAYLLLFQPIPRKDVSKWCQKSVKNYKSWSFAKGSKSENFTTQTECFLLLYLQQSHMLLLISRNATWPGYVYNFEFGAVTEQ